MKVEYLDKSSGRVHGTASTKYLKDKPYCALGKDVFATVKEDIDKKISPGINLITVATTRGSFKRWVAK